MAGTVLVRGEGGVVQEHDVPLNELVSDAVRKGRLQVVGGDGVPVPVADLDTAGILWGAPGVDGRPVKPTPAAAEAPAPAAKKTTAKKQ
jgi:hypothetical protein